MAKMIWPPGCESLRILSEWKRIHWQHMGGCHNSPWYASGLLDMMKGFNPGLPFSFLVCWSCTILSKFSYSFIFLPVIFGYYHNRKYSVINFNVLCAEEGIQKFKFLLGNTIGWAFSAVLQSALLSKFRYPGAYFSPYLCIFRMIHWE